MTPEKLIEETGRDGPDSGDDQRLVHDRNRIDMLATGIKSPVGVKIAGPNLQTIEQLGAQIDGTSKSVPGDRFHPVRASYQAALH